MTKIKENVHVYKEYANKEIAKILNMVLSPYSHMRACTCAHAHTYTLTHECTYTRCVTCGSLICFHVAP